MPEKRIVDSATGDVIYDSRHPSAASTRNKKASASRNKRPEPREAGLDTDLILKSLRSGSTDEKTWALKQIPAVRDPKSFETLSVAALELLVSRNPIFFESGLAAIAHTGIYESCFRLVDELLRSSPKEVVIPVLNVIADRGPGAIKLSRSIIRLVTDREFQASDLGRTLLATGLSSDAINALSRQLTSGSIEKRSEALAITEHLGDKASPLIPVLLNALEDSDDRLSRAVKHALIRVGFSEAGIPTIRRILRGGRRESQHRVLELLSSYGRVAQPASPIVIELLKRADLETLNCALKTLLVIGLDSSCIEHLYELVYHPQHEKRQLALDLAVNRLPDDLLQPMMLKLMADRDTGLREQASKIFQRGRLSIGGADSVKTLLRDERVAVKLLVLDTLGKMKERARPALKYILERIEDANTEVARAAASAFTEVGYEITCSGDLERVLSHRRQDRRLLVLNSLEKQSARAVDALPLVARRLGDPDWIVRDAARDAFIGIGFNESCMNEVRRLIDHQDREFRLAAIRALGACGLSAAAAAAFLDTRLNDEDAEVGRAASKALREVTRGIGR